MMYWWDGHMGGWGYALMGLGSLVSWALLILAVVVGIRVLQRVRSTHEPGDRPAPEQLLAERYARGEIDDDEYRRRLDTLAGGPPAVVPHSWPTEGR